jgi:hypothetical protein
MYIGVYARGEMVFADFKQQHQAWACMNIGAIGTSALSHNGVKDALPAPIDQIISRSSSLL